MNNIILAYTAATGICYCSRILKCSSSSPSSLPRQQDHSREKISLIASIAVVKSATGLFHPVRFLLLLVNALQLGSHKPGGQWSVYHRLYGSTSCCISHGSCQWERAIFDSMQLRDPSTTSRTRPSMENYRGLDRRWWSGQIASLTHESFCPFFGFLHQGHSSSRPSSSSSSSSSSSPFV